jgi:hypothetical protein
MSIKATLTCSTGTTGNQAVTVTSGKLKGASAPFNASCSSMELGATRATIKWKASGGRVTPTTVAWPAGSLSSTPPVTLDLPFPRPAVVTGSYALQNALLHVVSDPLGGGRCARSTLRGFAFTGAGGVSTLSIPSTTLWTGADIGAALPAGQDQLTSGGAWHELGGGGDIWGTADSFHYVSETMAGDGNVTTHVTSQQATDPWAKAGPMIRATTDPGSPYYAVLVTPGNGISVQWRSAQGSSTAQVLAPGAVPLYLMIGRDTTTGATPRTFFTAYTSPDGTTWSAVPGSTVALSMTGPLLGGFAITSHVQGVGSDVTLDTVGVSPGEYPPPNESCPSGWSCADVGAASPPGGQSLQGGTWSVQGGGGDIWGTADAFRYVWQSLPADGIVTALVTSETPTDPWAKGGLMARASTDPGAPYYAIFATPGNGVVVQWRATQGASTSQVAITGSAPVFLQLTRAGTTFSAATSSDGVTWTPVPGASMSVTGLSGTLLSGLAVASHNPVQVSTVVYNDVATPPATPTVTVCPDHTQFCLGSTVFYPYGASFYSSTSASGALSNPEGAIKLAQAQHLNTIRVGNWLDGKLQPGYATPLAQATSDASWRPADAFIADARAAGLQTWLDLSGFKDLLLNSCINPYAPAQYSAWDTYIRYAAQRVNTITGAAYATDPDILWVGFNGEPYPPGTWGPGSNPAGWPRTCPSALAYSTADLTNFYASVEATWKQYSTKLTMAGGLSYLDLSHNGIDYQAIFGNGDNDICGFKTYGGMEAWLHNGVNYCANTLRKPSVDVEWGYKQTLGDGTRAADFQGQFTNNATVGIAGNFYWNAGYLKRYTTYDVDNGHISPLTFAVVVKNAP